MPDILLELHSEELPPATQRIGAESLQRAMSGGLRDAGLSWNEAIALSTPRRLTLLMYGLPAESPPFVEERRGPRVGAPATAISGFARSAGIGQEHLEIRGEGKNSYHYAVLKRPGMATELHVACIAPQAIRSITWPKSMRWGRGAFRWPRPLRSIICLIGEGDQSRTIAFDLEGIPVGSQTRGHPFLAPGWIGIRSAKSYQLQLRKASVLLRVEERKNRILEGLERTASEEGLELVADQGLLEENAAMVEWPVVVQGSIDPAYRELPGEILRTAMRSHQRFFSLRRARGGAITAFAAVSDIESSDGNRRMRAGYERVLRARLADAGYFWACDRAAGLKGMSSRLGGMVHHAALGSVAERARRIAALARRVAPLVGADPALAEQAGLLSKADLLSSTVTEFPSLQGIVGGHLATDCGLSEAVANAIAQQYRPAGPGEMSVRQPVAASLVIADRVDSLFGFFAVGIRPTGSKDPYALRRSALALLRTLLENGFRVPITTVLAWSEESYAGSRLKAIADAGEAACAFVLERLRVYLRERGFRHDVLAAIRSDGKEDDVFRYLQRAEALTDFLDRAPEAGDLLAAYRRCSNILADEGVEVGGSEMSLPDPAKYREPEERALAGHLDVLEPEILKALNDEAYLRAMQALSVLRAPVDGFFDRVTVNASETDLRQNRLRQLVRVRETMESVAAFHELEG